MSTIEDMVWFWKPVKTPRYVLLRILFVLRSHISYIHIALKSKQTKNYVNLLYGHQSQLT